jgi:hypothetical protein
MKGWNKYEWLEDQVLYENIVYISLNLVLSCELTCLMYSELYIPMCLVQIHQLWTYYQINQNSVKEIMNQLGINLRGWEELKMTKYIFYFVYKLTCVLRCWPHHYRVWYHNTISNFFFFRERLALWFRVNSTK